MLPPWRRGIPQDLCSPLHIPWCRDTDGGLPPAPALGPTPPAWLQSVPDGPRLRRRQHRLPHVPIACGPAGTHDGHPHGVPEVAQPLGQVAKELGQAPPPPPWPPEGGRAPTGSERRPSCNIMTWLRMHQGLMGRCAAWVLVERRLATSSRLHASPAERPTPRRTQRTRCASSTTPAPRVSPCRPRCASGHGCWAANHQPPPPGEADLQPEATSGGRR